MNVSPPSSPPRRAKHHGRPASTILERPPPPGRDLTRTLGELDLSIGTREARREVPGDTKNGDLQGGGVDHAPRGERRRGSLDVDVLLGRFQTQPRAERREAPP